VHVPPLRNRKGDIPLLSQHLLGLFSDEMGLDPPTLAEEALKQLKNYAFPGNIRALKNLIERALIQCDGREIEPWHLDAINYSWVDCTGE
jgi:two-component system response regulator PilR (NtrC family)